MFLHIHLESQAFQEERRPLGLTDFDDESTKTLRNIGDCLLVEKAQHPRKFDSSS